MEITRFGPDDTDPVAAYAEIVSAARAVDSPWQPPLTRRRAEARLRHGWDGEVEVPFLGVVDETPVGVATLAVSEYDNLQLAWLGVTVHPDHRRRGHGSALLARLFVETRAAGRTLVGIDGWDDDTTRGFAARHGFEQKSVSVQRQQRIDELDWDELARLHDEARAAASAYDLERWEGRTPDDQLVALGGADRGDQRRAHRRPGARGRGLPARAGPRLRGRPARRRLPAPPRRGPAPRQRPAGRAQRGRRRRGDARPRLAARHRRRPGPPGPPPRAAAQDRDEPLAARRRARAGGRQHLQRRVQRPHDRRQRAARLPDRRPRAGVPALPLGTVRRDRRYRWPRATTATPARGRTTRCAAAPRPRR
ncbi:GNAT family N-acetyltransferase [Nocardioides anomalus]|uniref:GNAT family N-acetyltransferase n=1 Tax=Nocardioides anomalus TaxID=2712223 RepID=A0A6G6WD48_9ACTN|nr:GNAT family N-acetyltransferase [Nocardioides anomalus]